MNDDNRYSSLPPGARLELMECDERAQRDVQRVTTVFEIARLREKLTAMDQSLLQVFVRNLQDYHREGGAHLPSFVISR